MSAVVPLVVNAINNGLTKKDILLSNIFIIFLSNAFVTPLLWLLPPAYLYQLWQRRSLRIQNENKEEVTLTQKEMNEIFENPTVDIYNKLSYCGKTMMMTFLYLPIFPLGAIISGCGITILYFIEKYNLIRFYKIPEELNASIAMEYFYNFKLYLFISALSSVIFLNDLFHSWTIVGIVCFTVTLFLPLKNLMTNYLDIKEEDVITNTYTDAYSTFDEDYLRSNPIRRLEGQLKFLEAKCAKGEITEDQLMVFRKDLQEKGSSNEAMYRLNYTSKAAAINKQKKHVDDYKKKITEKISAAGGVINNPNQINGNNANGVFGQAYNALNQFSNSPVNYQMNMNNNFMNNNNNNNFNNNNQQGYNNGEFNSSNQQNGEFGSNNQKFNNNFNNNNNNQQYGGFNSNNNYYNNNL